MTSEDTQERESPPPRSRPGFFRLSTARLTPSAPPPAAPPPPTPSEEFRLLGGEDDQDDDMGVMGGGAAVGSTVPGVGSSYQDRYVSTGFTNGSDPTVSSTVGVVGVGSAVGITNYGLEEPAFAEAQWRRTANETYGIPDVESRRTSFSYLMTGRGNTTIRPNIGQKNSADGEALNEVIIRVRVMNLLACTAAILLEIPVFFHQFMLLHPARTVLGMYLAFFSGLVCCFEFHTPWIAERIQEYFGMMYHPLGRSFFLFLMGGLAIGQYNLFHFILGGFFWISAFFTSFAFCRYPEYRKRFDENQADLLQVASKSATTYAWANPDKVTTAASYFNYGSTSNATSTASAVNERAGLVANIQSL